MTSTDERSAIIRFRNVGRAFGAGSLRRSALRGVTLDIAPGECVLFVGQNGAGKSTLLRLAAGIDRPTEGEVLVFGGATDLAAVRDRTAYLGDDSDLYDFLSVRETLDFAARWRGIGRRERRSAVESIAAALGVTEYLDRRTRGLSLGMRRRTAIATAFFGDPELILLDEPTNGLDADGARAFRALLEERKARGRTMVVAGHDLDHVAAVCDRVVLLNAGSVQAVLGWTEFCARATAIDVTLEGLDAAAMQGIREAVLRSNGRFTAPRPAPAALDELWKRKSAP